MTATIADVQMIPVQNDTSRISEFLTGLRPIRSPGLLHHSVMA